MADIVPLCLWHPLPVCPKDPLVLAYPIGYLWWHQRCHGIRLFTRVFSVVPEFNLQRPPQPIPLYASPLGLHPAAFRPPPPGHCPLRHIPRSILPEDFTPGQAPSYSHLGHEDVFGGNVLGRKLMSGGREYPEGRNDRDNACTPRVEGSIITHHQSATPDP